MACFKWSEEAKRRVSARHLARKGIVLDVETLRQQYAGGMSLTDLALHYGLSFHGIRMFMCREGIERREKGFVHTKLRMGEDHHYWKGEDASYFSNHMRVKVRRGAAEHCVICGTTDKEATYHWANMTGTYPNPNDYESMCCGCHKRYDSARSALTGKTIEGVEYDAVNGMLLIRTDTHIFRMTGNGVKTMRVEKRRLARNGREYDSSLHKMEGSGCPLHFDVQEKQAA